uniref:Uncharacterized protein n=1 Tax=Schistocephalus solidus TaxID=70667 RepID=A0A0X3QAD7_SCHSO
MYPPPPGFNPSAFPHSGQGLMPGPGYAVYPGPNGMFADDLCLKQVASVPLLVVKCLTGSLLPFFSWLSIFYYLRSLLAPSILPHLAPSPDISILESPLVNLPFHSGGNQKLT